MSKTWFMTGTDTEVGKTLASTALLQAAAQQGYRCAGYKPVASGSTTTAAGLRNDDALALQANSSLTLSYAQVNPFTFAEPTSPHIVSVAEGKPIDFATMSQGLHHLQQRAEWVVVEGAGGWFTPLSDSSSFADWVQQERLPVILVVGVKLGCINHALLTAQAIQAAGLDVVGWIANAIVPPGPRHQEYMATLRQLLLAPLVGEIPHLPAGSQQSLASYIDLAPLM